MSKERPVIEIKDPCKPWTKCTCCPQCQALIVDLKSKNDRLEGINVQMAEEIAGLEAEQSVFKQLNGIHEKDKRIADLEAQKALRAGDVCSLNGEVEQLRVTVEELEGANSKLVIDYQEACKLWAETVEENATLQAQLALHQWVSGSEAEQGITYQCCTKKGEAYMLGSKGPSGNWFSAFGYGMNEPELIKPISLPATDKGDVS
jgi:hypothetical protein